MNNENSMKFFSNIAEGKNPFLLFLPFLILYVALVFILPTTGTSGDESRYLMLGENLLHGYYSQPSPHIDLGNGPGYPIILIPFLALHLPLVTITVLNAVLYYLSVVILYKSLEQFTTFKRRMAVCLFWGLYVNIYVYFVHILTEVLTAFLISLLIYTLLKCFRTANIKQTLTPLFFSGLIIGYLALVKPVFGYVIMFLISGMIILLITNRKSINYRKGTLILLVALLTTSPYLFYSFHLTGKVFYWGSNGGNNLYWMTTPFENENGSWIEYPGNKVDNPRVDGSDKLIAALHKKDFDEILKYTGVQQDDAYKRIAIDNIKSYPLKFIKNCFSNVGRILFNFPRSYELQNTKTLLRLPFTGIIVVLMLFSLIPTIINWRKLIFPIRFLLFFTLLYLGASMLGSAETRMFTMIVPVLLFWIAYVLQKSIKIKLRFNE